MEETVDGEIGWRVIADAGYDCMEGRQGCRGCHEGMPRWKRGGSGEKGESECSTA